jgi:hypothetical protein
MTALENAWAVIFFTDCPVISPDISTQHLDLNEFFSIAVTGDAL